MSFRGFWVHSAATAPARSPVACSADSPLAYCHGKRGRGESEALLGRVHTRNAQTPPKERPARHSRRVPTSQHERSGRQADGDAKQSEPQPPPPPPRVGAAEPSSLGGGVPLLGPSPPPSSSAQTRKKLPSSVV